MDFLSSMMGQPWGGDGRRPSGGSCRSFDSSYMIDLLLGWTIPSLLCMWWVMFLQLCIIHIQASIIYSFSHQHPSPSRYTFRPVQEHPPFCDQGPSLCISIWDIPSTRDEELICIYHFFSPPLPWTTPIDCSTGWVVCCRFCDGYAAAVRNCIE